MEKINLDGIDMSGINVDDIVNEAEKMVSTAKSINNHLPQAAKYALVAGGGVIVGAIAWEFAKPKVMDKIHKPEAKILHRKDKVIDVEGKEVDDEKEKKTKKKGTKKDNK